MDHMGRERRKLGPDEVRKPLGDLIREAIRKRMSEARVQTAVWVTTTNLGWVRWPLEDGRFAYCGIRRRGDFLTGEIGVAIAELELDELTMVNSPAGAPYEACRIQLGMLLHGHEKWWSTGGSEKTLIERLDWLATQMRQQMFSFLSVTTPPRAEPGNPERAA